MNPNNKQHGIAIWLAALFLNLFILPPILAAEPECATSGPYHFVCGPNNAEDLVRLPHTPWLIASGMAVDAAIYGIDTRDKSWIALYPTDAPREIQDMSRYPACPGSPDLNTFISHGLSLQPGPDGHSTLYVVGHGGREAIEVFDVDTNAEQPLLTWIGCVLTPDAMPANSVASHTDGSLLITIPLHTGETISNALAGKLTGGVYHWSPGDAGFSMIEGTGLPYANGIEISADGQEFFVASSGLYTVGAYSNTRPARLLRSSIALDIVPDNLHFSDDGRLLTAGLKVKDPVCGDVLRSQAFDLDKFAICARPFQVIAIEPTSMQSTVIADSPSIQKFSNITMGIFIENELWIGTFGGDRVAYRSMTPSK